MIEIPISRRPGVFAIIDEDDFEIISKHKWHLNYKGYAAASIWLKEEQKVSHPFMHRMIMKASKGQLVDHKNRNRLDCRKDNLRFCTPSQNSQNKEQARTIAPFKGLKYHKGLWQVWITSEKKRLFLGSNTDPKAAAQLYNNAALKYFGEFARLNIL